MTRGLRCRDRFHLSDHEVADIPTQQIRSSGRFACFDGLRALAALSVVGVHTAFVSGLTGRSWLGQYTARLEIGVSVFFVISGFLLYRPFALAHLGGRSAGPTRAFWTRRLRRIVPAYWLAFVAITYVFGVGTVRHDWWSPLVYLGFAQIYLPHYVLTGVTQAWSLCTEMSFYLLLPLWAALIARIAGKQTDPRWALRVEAVGAGALIVAGETFRAVCLAVGGQWPALMLDWLPAYLDLFGVGMLLAVLSAWQSTTTAPLVPRFWDQRVFPWACWAGAAAAFVAVANVGLPVAPLYAQTLGLGLTRQALYGTFAVLLVAPAVFGPQTQGAIRAALRWRPVVAVGVVSYGVYLWHQAWVALWLRWTGGHLFALSLWPLVPFVLAMAVVSATASWWGLERWLIHARGRRVGRQWSAPWRRAQPAVAPTSLAGAQQ